MFRPSETTEVSMEETLCTVEHGRSNCPSSTDGLHRRILKGLPYTLNVFFRCS